MLTNHTSTDRSTCTTSAERKKSFSGNTSWMPGVRDNTSKMASRPEPISAISPNHNHALASALGAPPETVMLCEFTITPRKIWK